MTIDDSRRSALVGFAALAAGAAAFAAGPSHAATTERIIPPGARELSELMDRLRRAPRRREFKTVPMILEHPNFWDDEAQGDHRLSRHAQAGVGQHRHRGSLAQPDAELGQYSGLLLWT
jgi:hypothetical protein